MKQQLESFLNKLPYIRGLYQHKKNFIKNSCYPAGHYYSPIINIEEVKRKEEQIWNSSSEDKVPGVDLNTDEQINLINEFNQYYNELPFKNEQQNNLRYYFDNSFYSYTDGIILYSFIRHFKPKRIIEIGSGFSSALMLDCNDIYFNNGIELTFIEPYPERLYSLLKNNDKKNTKIITSFIQDVDLKEFDKLEAGDILFIDSTHVSKTGSDVNYLFFDILPRLKKGVLIHVHDVFFPFEYPKEWVYEGRNWNEDYLLKAFLMFNSTFKIKVFSHYLHQMHSKVFKEMPLSFKNQGGNIWIEKLD